MPLQYSPSEVLHRWLVLTGMHFLFELFPGSPLWFSIGLHPWLAPLEVILGGWVFWIFLLGPSIPPSVHLLVWLVGLLVLDYVVHKSNRVRHEKLHLWKTCWIVLRETPLYQISFPVFSWGFMPCGICTVPFLVLCTSRLLRVVPMMCGRLSCYELLLVFQVGLTVCGWNKILQIYGYRLIVGEAFLIVLSDFGWFLPVVIVYPTVAGNSLFIFSTVPLWSGFWRFVSLSLHCLICDFLGELTDTWCSWK